MAFLKEYVIFRILSFALALTLLLPSAVKVTHAFNHHKHEVCLGEESTHLHKLDIDCKFYDFKITHQFLLFDFDYKIFIPKSLTYKDNSSYTFLRTYQQLHFSLRGPPNHT
ncbi:hypothetical protein [Yeosuana sp. AK3]